MVNTLLAFKLEWRRHFNIVPKKKDFDINDYEIVTTLNEGNTYLGHLWGKYHPDNHSQYWDDSMVKFTNGRFIISTKYSPTVIDNITIPYMVGVVNSKEKFLYGYFESYVTLPYGDGQWPAFWLCADNWYSEIDILEAYSRENDYGDMRYLQSNIYYTYGNQNIGGKNHPMLKGYDTIKVAVQWEKDFVRFFYNDQLVREITDIHILDKLNKPMSIILNSGVDKEFKISSDSTVYFTNTMVYKRKGQ